MAHQYLALLRGINVGGNNKIKMADLKACFEQHGFTDVATYIQSGNVLFTASKTDTAALSGEIERMLAQKFAYNAPVVVISHDQLKAIAADAPKGFGASPDTHKYDVIFLKPPLTTSEAIQSVETREGVDAVSAGTSALYFSRRADQLTKSRLSKLTAKPAYQRMTIRNWNTAIKLLAMMEARA